MPEPQHPLTRRTVLRGAALASGVAALGLRPGTANAAAAQPLFSFDLRYVDHFDLRDPVQARTAYDHMQLVSCVQGIANRSSAQLFVDFIQGDQFGDLDLDEYWLAKLQAPGEFLAGRPVTALADLDALVQQFLPMLAGAVVWDPTVPATANVAATVAGVENLVAIRYDTSADSLYTKYVAGASPLLPARRWLVNPDGSPLFTGTGTISGTGTPSTGSAKCDAYIWAKELYLDTGRCAPGHLGYYVDGYALDHITEVAYPHRIQSSMVMNHDFLIARRGFIFDLSPWSDETPVDDPNQPLGTDTHTLRAILLSAYQQNNGGITAIHGFIPVFFKYTTFNNGGSHPGVSTEWESVQIASAYNGYLDADTDSIGPMANGSLFQHYPLASKYPQPASPTLADLQAKGFVDDSGAVVPKRYVMFYVGDYDSAGWLYHLVPRLWDDPARGTVPLSWAFNPNLDQRIAPAMVYTRQTATPMDVFISGDSGAGYLNPSMLQEPREFSGLPDGRVAWQDHCTQYFHRWDLSITGFIIDGNAPALDADGRSTYATFSPNGFAEQKSAPLGKTGKTPYIQMTVTLPNGTPTAAATALQSALVGDLSTAPSMPEFHSMRTVAQTATWHQQLVAAVESAIPNAQATFVDAITFYALLKQHLQGVTAMPTGATVPAQGTGQVVLTVTSWEPGRVNASINLTPPAGWRVTPAEQELSLAHDVAAQTSFAVTAPDGVAVGSDVEFTITTTARGQHSQSRMLMTAYPTLRATRATAPVQLSGEMDAQWQAAEAINVTSSDPIVTRFGKLSDKSPNGGTVRVLWDDTYLYCHAEIADDVVTVADPSNSYFNDGVAWFAAFGDWGFKVDTTVPTADGAPLVNYLAGTSTDVSGNGTNDDTVATTGYLRTDNGYNLVAAIEWRRLVDYTPTVGDTLRFTPLITDRDADTGNPVSIWGQLMWVGSGDNPQTYGYLELTDTTQP